MLIRRIKLDSYLGRFVDYCKEKFGDNLAAVVVYGSYAWRYFDKKKSDYDIFIFLKRKTILTKEEFIKELKKKKFRKIALVYFMTLDEMIDRAYLGHFTSYITLLKSGKAVYFTKEYKIFLRKLKKLNIFQKTIDVASVEEKSIVRAKKLKKLKGNKAVKWALPSIRVQLQMLTFLRKKRLIWSLRKNLRKNKDILTKEEIRFMKSLDRKVRKHSSEFSKNDKEMALNLIYKLNKEIVLHLADLIRR